MISPRNYKSGLMCQYCMIITSTSLEGYCLTCKKLKFHKKLLFADGVKGERLE
jgi:hypothetical protein